MRNSGFTRLIAAATAAAVLAGCASAPRVTAEDFQQDTSKLSNIEVCRGVHQFKYGTSEYGAARHEFYKRKLTLAGCEELEGIYAGNNSGARTAGTLLAVAALTAVALAGSKSGGGVAAPASLAPPTDYEWAWDEFTGTDGRPTWACRGKQTGQFADLERCRFMFKVDATWPGLQLN
jgi:hypothetical protein